MFVLDSQGAQYQLDEGLRQRADQLMRSPQFQKMISHVDLDQVIFLRLTGTKAKWHGKCMYIGKAPLTIIPKFVINRLNDMGLLDLKNVHGFDADIFDVRFIVIINDDVISTASGNISKVEDLTLVHELMHIHADGDKLVKHDLEDFKDLVQDYGPYWAEGIINNSDSLSEDDSENLPKISFKPISATSEIYEPEESN